MGYKSSELRLKVNGYADLASAVMRQWNLDGRPRGDLIGVQAWGQLLSMHQQVMRRQSAIMSGSIQGLVRRK